MNSKTSTASSGLSFGGALFLLFLALKLTGAISWSWWWITCPLWGPLALVLAFLLVFVLAKLAVALVQEVRRKQAKRRRSLI